MIPVMFFCFRRILERAVFELFLISGQNSSKPCDGVAMGLLLGSTLAEFG